MTHQSVCGHQVCEIEKVTWIIEYISIKKLTLLSMKWMSLFKKIISLSFNSKLTFQKGYVWLTEIQFWPYYSWRCLYVQDVGNQYGEIYLLATFLKSSAEVCSNHFWRWFCLVLFYHPLCLVKLAAILGVCYFPICIQRIEVSVCFSSRFYLFFYWLSYSLGFTNFAQPVHQFYQSIRPESVN